MCDIRFDYERFASLLGDELVEYMEPIAQLKDMEIARSILERMLAELPSYDGYHTAYALQLGFDHAPDLYLKILPMYLSHSEPGVACTAYNILNKVSGLKITPELVDGVRKSREGAFPSRIIEKLASDMEARSGDGY